MAGHRLPGRSPEDLRVAGSGAQEVDMTYEVRLLRSPGNPRPDVVIYWSENREHAIKAMHDYVVKNGYSVQDRDGRFSISDVALFETERIAGKDPVSVTRYRELFDVYNRRL